jgi:hypothetical protein
MRTARVSDRSVLLSLAREAAGEVAEVAPEMFARCLAARVIAERGLDAGPGEVDRLTEWAAATSALQLSGYLNALGELGMGDTAGEMEAELDATIALRCRPALEAYGRPSPVTLPTVDGLARFALTIHGED